MQAQRPTLLVIGASGSIGHHVLACANRSGYRARALVRSANNRFPPEVEVVKGDLTRIETLRTAVEDVDFIVFTHGTYGDPQAAAAVDYGAVRNVLTALGGRPARIALMSTIGATDRKGSHDWKRRGERLLRASGLPYTIVRPGWFDCHAPGQHRLIMIQGDTRLSGTPRDGVIARAQVADVLVSSLGSAAALGKTLELHAEPGLAQSNLEPLFEALAPDSSAQPDGVYDKQNMPMDQEPLQIREELLAIQTLFRG